MQEVIATRREFVETSRLILSLNVTDTSVEFREAIFILKEKVENKIANLSKEIFKLPEDIEKKLREKDEKLYEALLPFAKVAPKNKREGFEVNENDEEVKRIKEEINSQYSEEIRLSEKTQKEFDQWLDKKIKLNIEVIDIDKLPKLEPSIFCKVAKMLCNRPDEVESDGEEVE